MTAVHDGYALRKAVTRSPLGGDALTSVVLKYLEKVKKVPVKPRYEFTRARKGRRRRDDGRFGRRAGAHDARLPSTQADGDRGGC